MLKSKIHRATVTDSDLHYEGSLTLDETLMKAADIFPFEHIHVYNITNGHRFETYVTRGEKGSGIICVNGAAVHFAREGRSDYYSQLRPDRGSKRKELPTETCFCGWR